MIVIKQVERFQKLAGILKESRASDAMLEKYQFLEKFLYRLVEGDWPKFREVNLTYKDVYTFMSNVKKEMIQGDYSTLEQLSSLQDEIKVSSEESLIDQIENLVKNEF
jgi:hypothetical protein